MSRSILLGAAVLALVACQVTQQEADYQVTAMALPHGDVEDGRQAFLTLGCVACHRVAWEPDLPEPVSRIDAPELGTDLIRQTAGGVATSIVVPSHRIPSEVRRNTDDGKSPMGDFAEVMTVQELIDLVAYLRSPGGAEVARIPGRAEDLRRPPI